MKSILLLLLLSFLTALAAVAEDPAPPANWKVVAVDSTDDNLPADTWVKLDSIPQVITQTQPVYPKKEKEAGITGKYWVKMLINKQGYVRKATILKGEGGSEGLEEAALAAAKKWTFRPGIVNGKPEACWVTTAVVFTLVDKPDSTKTQPPNPK
ncbi:MAG: TonB family protein [Candidatus Zixiibacteriota bacterium]